MSLELVTLVGGQEILAHTKDKCAGRFCCIHNPSDHHMVSWRQVWREDVGTMERICPHRTGHPDPDDLAYRLSLGKDADSVHGCDGCCNPKGRIRWEKAK